MMVILAVLGWLAALLFAGAWWRAVDRMHWAEARAGAALKMLRDAHPERF